MWKVGFVPNSNALNWIVPYSSVSNLNCASFQDHQSKLCLSPITQNWSVPNYNLPQWLVPYSNVSKLNCALFQCPTIEYCLVPMPSKWIVPYSNVAKWNVPYSNAIKLSCALFQYHKMKCALFLFHQIELCLIPMWQNEMCLIPMSQNEMCLIPFPSKLNVPYSFSIKIDFGRVEPLTSRIRFWPLRLLHDPYLLPPALRKKIFSKYHDIDRLNFVIGH